VKGATHKVNLEKTKAKNNDKTLQVTFLSASKGKI
jgi:hypothetical protein